AGIALQPERGTYNWMKAQALIPLAQHDAGIRELDPALDKSMKNYDAPLAKEELEACRRFALEHAVEQERAERSKEARDFLRIAIKAGVEDAGVWCRYAFRSGLLHDFPEHLAGAERGIKLDDKIAVLHLYRGRALFERGRAQEAVTELETAIAMGRDGKPGKPLNDELEMPYARD